MRLVMVMLTGLVLVIAAARSRAILLRAIDETTRRANLTRYLPPRIAEWLAETSVDEVRRRRQQRVAVLFADIRGFTQRAEPIQRNSLQGQDPRRHAKKCPMISLTWIKAPRLA